VILSFLGRRGLQSQNEYEPLGHRVKLYVHTGLRNFKYRRFGGDAIFLSNYDLSKTASVVQWSEFLATDPEVPGSIPDATKFLSSGSGTGSSQPREDN
jgi:hypothetical protein